MKADYIKIFTDTNIIINGLQVSLEAEGIPTLVKDRFESARLGGFGELQASVDIFVLNQDLVRSKKILTTYQEKINA